MPTLSRSPLPLRVVLSFGAFAIVLGTAVLVSHNRLPRANPTFDTLMQKVRQRQRVIDSVASTINTDTLYRAYHSMLVAPHPESVAPLIDCIERRMMWQRGMYPAQRAIQRMKDTVWARVEGQVSAMEARIPASGYLQSNDSLCGPFGRRGPLIIDGVPLDPTPGDSMQVRR